MYELKKNEEYLSVENKNNRSILLNGCEIFRGSNFETTVLETNLWCLEKYYD